MAEVAFGDRVFGTADWANMPTAGASDRAVMNRWFAMPEGLDFIHAAALPMTVDTAFAHLRWLGLTAGNTLMVHGAGSTIGFAAVQIALRHGMRVIATAGDTYAQQLRGFGAEVTSYGDGMVQRVANLADGPVDVALDTAPVGGSLPDLIEIAGGDPRKVMTISDFTAAAEVGARSSATEDLAARVEALPEHAQLAADGAFVTPIAATFPLDQWETALQVSVSGSARGKLVLVPRSDAMDA